MGTNQVWSSAYWKSSCGRTLRWASHIMLIWYFSPLLLLLLLLFSFRNRGNLRACLVTVFKNYFLFLKTKNTKNMFGEGDVFLFFVFFVFSKTTFLRTIKRCFHCSKNRLFSVLFLPSFCVFLTSFCVSTKVSSTKPPHPHPQALSSFLNY